MSSATVTEKNNIVVIQIFGAISIENIEELERVWNEQLARRPEILAIDFHSIDHIDSIGISHMVKLARQAIMNEIELLLFDLSPSVLNILRTASFDKFFNIMTRATFNIQFEFFRTE